MAYTQNGIYGFILHLIYCHAVIYSDAGLLQIRVHWYDSGTRLHNML